MPRSSGHHAMPRSAMRFEDSAIVSAPSKAMEPSRRGTAPMIDLSVVVLPAPLRPSSVTTSPGATSKSTPCRMCDSPYQACKPRTASSGLPAVRVAAGLVAASGMTGTEVGLHHFRVGGHRRVVALREDLAARQDCDVVR